MFQRRLVVKVGTTSTGQVRLWFETFILFPPFQPLAADFKLSSRFVNFIK